MRAHKTDLVSHTLSKLEELFPSLNLVLEVHENMSKEEVTSSFVSATIDDKVGIEIAAKKGTNLIYIRLLVLEGVNLELDNNFGTLVNCMFSSIMNYLGEFCTIVDGVSQDDIMDELGKCCDRILEFSDSDNSPSKVNEWVIAQSTTPKGEHIIVPPGKKAPSKDILSQVREIIKNTTSDKKERFF